MFANNRYVSIKLLKNVTLSFVISHLYIASSHAGWAVEWIDAFDGDSVNWENWTAQTKANYNNEVQCYTNDETSPQRNLDVSDGTLKIIARKQAIKCPGLDGLEKSWTSARINTKDKAEFLYGRIETRLKFSELRGGTWPAFWMLENRINEQPVKGDNDNIGWPNPGAGEIDVWEWYSNSGDRYITNFFNAGKCGGEVRIPYENGAKDVTDFHTYAIEWTPDTISFFMDEDMLAQHNISDCEQYKEPMFVLLNVAMGGMLGGEIDPSINTATLEIDYVAHCVKSKTSDATRCNEQAPTLTSTR